MVVLPDEVFIKAVSMTELDHKIRIRQRRDQHKIEEWKGKYCLLKRGDGAWYHRNALVITEGMDDYQAVLAIYHDALTAGHLGVVKTIQAVV